MRLLIAVLAIVGLFILLRPNAWGANRAWSYDMVEDGEWGVGRVVAVCDGVNRVYVARGETGIALHVVPGGCGG